jgi:hypothetical protein
MSSGLSVKQFLALQKHMREIACPYPVQAIQESHSGLFNGIDPQSNVHANPSAY